jgi:hypothetical protein
LSRGFNPSLAEILPHHVPLPNRMGIGLQSHSGDQEDISGDENSSFGQRSISPVHLISFTYCWVEGCFRDRRLSKEVMRLDSMNGKHIVTAFNELEMIDK